MNFHKPTIDAHEQKYVHSCIPSSVEMVLKLLGKVISDYYNLQNEWDNKTTGSLNEFDGKTIEGLTFGVKFGYERNPHFPFTDLFQTIDAELVSGRYVIISLKSEENKYHMWVIYEKLKDDYLAFSKGDKHTIYFNGSVKKCIYSMQGTDILIYKL